MARQELHSSKLPNVDQRAPLPEGATSYAGDVVTGETIGSADADYLADLAMNEEPVTIMLISSSERNPPTSMPVWCNGRGAEVWAQNGWREIVYLPIGVEMIVKRKYLGIIISAKTDSISTQTLNMDGERPENRVSRVTSPVASFTIIYDANPRGPEWARSLRRRQL